MQQPDGQFSLIIGHPKSFGWLRRIDLEVGSIVYEKPDGELVVFPPGLPDQMLKVMRPPRNFPTLGPFEYPKK